MRILLACLAILFNMFDNLTTYIALTTPIANGEMVEVNGIAGWCFEQIGMELTLGLEMWATILIVIWVATTDGLGQAFRITILCILAVIPAMAVLNNLYQMSIAGML